jgi:hypothetical protein
MDDDELESETIAGDDAPTVVAGDVIESPDVIEGDTNVIVAPADDAPSELADEIEQAQDIALHERVAVLETQYVSLSERIDAVADIAIEAGVAAVSAAPDEPVDEPHDEPTDEHPDEPGDEPDDGEPHDYEREDKIVPREARVHGLFRSAKDWRGRN